MVRTQAHFPNFCVARLNLPPFPNTIRVNICCNVDWGFPVIQKPELFRPEKHIYRSMYRAVRYNEPAHGIPSVYPRCPFVCSAQITY